MWVLIFSMFSKKGGVVAHHCRARSFPYCDARLSIDDRVADLIARLSLAEKIAMISPQPEHNLCFTHTAGKAELGLPPYAWLVEVNSACVSTRVLVRAQPVQSYV
jgi:hypothetical protein